MAPEVTSRAEARRAGFARYYTGKPCKRGHVVERLVSNSSCTVCAHDLTLSWRAANPDRHRANKRAQYAANREKEAARNARYHATHRQQIRARKVNNYLSDPGAHVARVCKHQVGHQMPAWADETAIVGVYQNAARLSQETGTSHHVDHIIPRNGVVVYPDGQAPVSGLHVPDNLQILTGTENSRKGNRYVLSA